MRRLFVGNFVRTPAAPAVAAKPSRPTPLDAESLKKVAGGNQRDTPFKGW